MKWSAAFGVFVQFPIDVWLINLAGLFDNFWWYIPNL